MRNRRSPAWDIVRNAEWRRAFLDCIDAVPGFQKLLQDSRAPDTAGRRQQVARVARHALPAISTYEREHLVAARQYYNTLHLIAFWRYYREQLENAIDRGALADAAFPVFRVLFHTDTRVTELRSLPVAYFQQLHVVRTSEFPAAFRYRSMPDGRDAPRERPEGPADALGSLAGKLFLLARLRTETITFFYNYFIDRERRLETPVWDAYAIHFFLDQFLYSRNGKPTFSAGFDRIFFSSNARELVLYLTHLRDTGTQAGIAEVSAFLARQRRYYLELASTISLPDVDLLNSRKDLLTYDEQRGVVVCTPETGCVAHPHAAGTGRIKMDGCPFAVTRGVHLNALIELYADYDGLALHLLDHLDEFRQCFA